VTLELPPAAAEFADGEFEYITQSGM
jgi:hypothetical protein